MRKSKKRRKSTWETILSQRKKGGGEGEDQWWLILKFKNKIKERRKKGTQDFIFFPHSLSKAPGKGHGLNN